MRERSTAGLFHRDTLAQILPEPDESAALLALGSAQRDVDQLRQGAPAPRRSTEREWGKDTSVYRRIQSTVAFAWEAYCVFRLEEDVEF